jgi:hypothetical protein
MQKDDLLLEKAKKMIEAQLCWGDSSTWVNQDFIALSEKITQKTSSSISPVTLKRVWGKVKYNGIPQTYTLNTLVKFVGFESWRDFSVKNDEVTVETTMQAPAEVRTQEVISNGAQVDDLLIPQVGLSREPPAAIPARSPKSRILHKQVLIILVLVFAGISFGTYKYVTNNTSKASEYSFSSHTTLNAGLPNSVIFDYDATKSPEDSVIIQQSWDNHLQRKVSKRDHQATMIYYFPGYFNPKLIVNGRIVKEHGLLVKSKGWVAALLENKLPVYFNKQDVMKAGKMGLSIDKIETQNISLAPKAPILSFCNVQDFGDLYTDDFEFETAVKNEYRAESSVCQISDIYLLCKGTAIHIPLCTKGCESALNFFFTSYEVSGKKADLSAFGVDFNKFVKVKIQSKAGKAKIFLNDKLAYAVDHGIMRAQIIGVDIAFQGTGSVDYVRLGNNKQHFVDEF